LGSEEGPIVEIGMCLEQIRMIQTWSAKAWGLAVDTAGPEYDGGSSKKAEEMKALADSCDAEYDAVIECLEGQYADWARLARQHLEDARSLESEGGDAFYAQMALQALDEYLAEEGAEQ
jgi:hypothetical protein